MGDGPAMLELVLKKGREKSVRRRHPWVMSGAIASGEPEDGDPKTAQMGVWTGLRSASGERLGFGHYSPNSSLRVRLLAFGTEDPGEALLEERIRAAVARRASHPLLQGTNALRLVNAEADGLPGLVVDRYADVVVVKASAAGMHERLDRITAVLSEATGATHGFARADARSARREGIPVFDGPLWGGPPPELVMIDERGRELEVDVVAGQKTGFYLDQRDARDLVERLAAGRRVLDLFSYTGGFAVAAARGKASHVTLVDSSQQALVSAERNLARNAPECDHAVIKADAFEWLRDKSPEAEIEPLDLLILDPPPLARNARDVNKAARGYKDLVLHGCRRAAPGAFILVFSCSYHVGPDLFQKIVFGAALDAHRSVQILAPLGQPADHPILVEHPEGRYLHGLLLQVID
jgi:23S rRNA (cytosine1962-C5)-methyltransferase